MAVSAAVAAMMFGCPRSERDGRNGEGQDLQRDARRG